MNAKSGSQKGAGSVLSETLTESMRSEVNPYEIESFLQSQMVSSLSVIRKSGQEKAAGAGGRSENKADNTSRRTCSGGRNLVCACGEYADQGSKTAAKADRTSRKAAET